jgi:predicted ATPase/class 3 adenylate cyclase
MRVAGQHPTDTFTFLFTDLEGSTRLWEEHPEAMAEVLRRHDEILRAAVARHGGTVVKTTGDGIHAVAPSARAGVAAAIEAQQVLSAEPWDPVPTLRIRMGLHTGPATRRDGDYFGSAVNRAARLMSVACGGQVLVSQTVEQLLKDDRIRDVELVDLGVHLLRDLSRSERIFQVAAPGIARTFPPLRTVDVFAGNLPSQSSPFFGREADLAALTELLAKYRLVTLLGPGGVGKTRLALQAVAGLLEEHPDGVWLCELASVRDPATIGAFVATTLGAVVRDGGSPDDAIVDLVSSRRVLVVLDNCEHVLDAAASLSGRLLRECPHIRLVATSREPLDVDGEQRWPVPPLPVPSAVTILEVQSSPAAELFVERSRAVHSGFTLTDDNVASIVEICRRLDGLPLALELTAARTNALSPAQIASMLDERFRLLGGTGRRRDERHRTLQATVDWSFELLPTDEQVVFERLGAFPGSFDAEAAAAVASDGRIAEYGTIDALAGLVSRSMVSAEPTDDGSMRYVLLETLREYARARLAERGELDRLARRHAQYYVRRAEAIGSTMMGPDEIEWRPRLRVELSNLRAAASWALAAPAADDQRLAGELIAPLSHQSVMDPATGISDWAVQALELHVAMTEAARFGVLCCACYHALRNGDYETMSRLAATAIDSDALPVARFPHMPYVSKATSCAVHGDIDGAIQVFEEGEQVLRALGAPDYDLAILAGARGLHEAAFGSETATTCSEQALALARRVGNPSCLVGGLFAVGFAAVHEDPDRAMRVLDEGLALAQAGCNASYLGNALAVSARLRLDQGDDAAAADLMRQSAEHFKSNPDRPSLVTALSLGLSVIDGVAGAQPAAIVAGAVTGPYAPLSQLFLTEHRRFEETLAELRGDLGPDRYEEAASRGKAMTPDQLLDVVIDGLTRASPDCEPSR